LVIAVILGYWVVMVYRLGGLWSALPEYSYGWSVPMLCLILFLDRWRTRPRMSAKGDSEIERSRHFGGQLLLFAAVVFVFTRLALEINPLWRMMAWGMAFATLGITYGSLRLIGGAAYARHFFFPVFFFLLAVPWHTRIEVPFIQMLTELNATMTVELLAFLKVAAVRMGSIILIEPGMVGVQEACSGIRSFQSTLMVALFLGELFRFSFWRRVMFVVAGAMLSFAFNIVRTSFLVWTCNREGLQAVDKFHDPAGWTILAASVTGLALIGWWLYRKQAKEALPQTGLSNSELPQGDFARAAVSLSPVVLILFCTLLITELGTRWWFRIHERPGQKSAVNWGTLFDTQGANLSPLKITREVQGTLGYDRGDGREWRGGGGERWQAFYFVWDEPKTLSRRVACMVGALGHDPALCFTRAGMQLRQTCGKKRYVANGVPLVFEEYEFADRNVPIFVFSCAWERNEPLSSANELRTEGVNFSKDGLRELFSRLARGKRGVTDEVRVFKLGVWGPRTIDEAEAAFQQQLNLLVHSKT